MHRTHAAEMISYTTTLVHATAMLNVVKGRTEVGNFCQKVAYFYVSNPSNLLLPFFQHLLCFSYCKGSVRCHRLAKISFFDGVIIKSKDSELSSDK